MDFTPFSPAEGKTQLVANATSATAAMLFPQEVQTLAFTNSSATAIVFVRVTYYDNANDTMTGVAPTVTTDFPLLPNSQIRRFVAPGRFKAVRTIASAADGNTYVTPGTGF